MSTGHFCTIAMFHYYLLFICFPNTLSLLCWRRFPLLVLANWPPATRQGGEKPFLRSTFVLHHFTLTTTPQRLHQQAFSSMIFRRVCFSLSLSLFLFIYLFITSTGALYLTSPWETNLGATWGPVGGHLGATWRPLEDITKGMSGLYMGHVWDIIWGMSKISTVLHAFLMLFL